MLSGSTTQKVRSPNRFLSGVSVLTVSALIVKVIGLFYKIPLLRCLGTEGMGYFNTAYELYALFCVVSTAGLPVAMAILMARYRAEGRMDTVRRIDRIALFVFILLGAVGSVILFGFSTPFARLLKNAPAAASLRFISPTVFLICVSGAVRGYFQGKGNMLPTAISQVIEALGKLVLGLLLAIFAGRNGCSVPQIAAFAVLGLTLGTGISTLYLLIHKRCQADGAARLTDTAIVPARNRDILSELMQTAVPVTLSAGIISMTKLTDVALILRRLQAAGYSASQANSMYGCYSTLAVPVFNILPSLTTSVALSVVPALAAALQKRGAERGSAHEIGVSAFRLTVWLAIPAAMGLFVYAEDILSVLFAHESAAVAQAVPWLRILALSIPSACLVTVCGAMLQAAGRPRLPIYAMLTGVAFKCVCAYFLLGCKDIGMMGAPISSLLCDCVIVAMELRWLGRYLPDVCPGGREGLSVFLLPLLPASLIVFCVSYLFDRLSVSGTLSFFAEMSLIVGLYGVWALLSYARLQRKAAAA